jgi:hypothetical protein
MLPPPAAWASRNCWSSRVNWVDGAVEGGDGGAELGEFLVLDGDCVLEPGDGGAEPGLVLVVRAALADRWVNALRGRLSRMAGATTVSAPLDR